MRWLLITCLMAAPLGAVTVGSAASGVAPEARAVVDDAAPASPAGTSTVPVLEVPEPEVTASAARTDLLQLAAAWEENGGSTGFPFWEKAYRRWLDRRITDVELRQYTLSYREVLANASEALDSADLATDETQEIRRLLVDSVEARIEALGQLGDYLEGRIEAARIGDASTEDPQDSQSERERQYERFDEDLQRSYRLTRESMNDAQVLLEEGGESPIPNTSFL